MELQSMLASVKATALMKRPVESNMDTILLRSQKCGLLE